ncbi:N-acetylmuramoyl-L-alanine amidase [Thermosyntropha lipolytica DSM 11003]|uniref:N-acetylmuramoyl-L-alanine amidase n=1 Tax=Thermosyntropha lipolytica DSM 11003 TaxID=1123382 RepID=A0A1M5MDX5_9FIRM|nr:N-acetylmuramoyl-L-alanine amidase [Thermosyntropha lipolytica]SHG75436.1 N-acetylmuramoyl-L-alanine amidase [Thermosyntropha lipolytica DSM 11003]
MKKYREFLSRPRPEFIIVFSGFFLLCMLAAVWGDERGKEIAAYNLVSKIIVVDPGHGGVDTGATRGDIVEKDITLRIAERLAVELAKNGAAVIMTRKGDTDLVEENFKGSYKERHRLGLSHRVEKANQSGAHLFVSIHTNADPDPRWRGAQTFYHPDSIESKKAAEAIQEAIKDYLKNTSRSALAGDYFVMNNTEMPAVLVEVGFISNPEEGKLLCDAEYQQKIAYAICQGIEKYFSAGE